MIELFVFDTIMQEGIQFRYVSDFRVHDGYVSFLDAEHNYMPYTIYLGPDRDITVIDDKAVLYKFRGGGE